MFMFLLFLPLLLFTGDASAQVVSYDRAAEFLAAIEPDILIDFEEIEAPSDQSYAGGYEASGVLVFASDGYMHVRNYDAASNGFLYGADRERQSYVQIDLPPGTTAVGANVTTFYTNAVGTVKVSLSSGEQYWIAVNRWSSSGLGPASSYFGAISIGTLEWIRFQPIENDDPRFFEYDSVILDNIAVAFEPPQTCQANLELCEAELLACYDAVAFEDADADSEADATDACPDTAEGAEVDAAGCSQAQFCGAVKMRRYFGAFECFLSDWQNDEVLDPRDCRVERDRGHRGRRRGSCVPR
jgi:hypothetical protein